MKETLFKRNSIIRKYQPLVNQINSLEETFKTFNNSELRAQNFKLKKRYQESQNLDSLIAESFALTREASFRTLGLRHFDVQLIGGLVLNNQKIAEILKKLIGNVSRKSSQQQNIQRSRSQRRISTKVRWHWNALFREH